MNLAGAIFRFYSYIYQFILALFLTALGGLTLASGQNNLSLGMLPWKGAALTYWVFGLGLAGLVMVALAVAGVFRYLFPLWCLVIAILMIRGFFLSSYVFAGAGQFQLAVWLTIGALIAFAASLSVLRPRREKGY